MKAPEDRSVSHSISCKPLQWMRMQELAERAGRPTSPFIVDRVLKRDGFGDGQDGHALVLDQDGQRDMQEAAVRAEAALSELLGPAGGFYAGPCRNSRHAVRGASRRDGAGGVPGRDAVPACPGHRPRPRRRHRSTGRGTGPARRVTGRERGTAMLYDTCFLLYEI